MSNFAWQAELKDAHFRGVPFKVDVAEKNLGWGISNKPIRVSKAKNGEKATVKIKEKLANQWRITAHFAGNDYLDAKRAFISVIEDGAPGELQLPTESPVFVYPEKATIIYSNGAGGYEDVRVVFIETTADSEENISFPTKTTDTEGQLNTSADSAFETFPDEFSLSTDQGAEPSEEDGIATSVGVAKFVETKTAELVEKFSDDILSVLPGGSGDPLNDVISSAQSISEDATTLIQTPQILASQITSLVDEIVYVFTNPIDAFNAQLTLIEYYATGLPTYSPATDTEQGLEDNSDAMSQIVYNAALAGASRSVALTEFESLDQALFIKSKFDAAARAQQLNNGDISGYDNSYYAIANMQAAVNAHIESQGQLPSNITLTFEDQMPAVAMAQDIYDDADRADELVRRNDIRNPLFCNREMVVLSE